MTREPDFDELIGAEASGAERERLRHAHDLLLQAGPPPELPPSLERAPSFDAGGVVQLSRRRVVKRRTLLLLAASLTIVAVFFAGYAVRGGSSSAAPKPVAEIALTGTTVHPKAQATLSVWRASDGNWPMTLSVIGLPKLSHHRYYEVYLVRGGRPWGLCGTFRGSGSSKALTVTLNAPYSLQKGDSWVVTQPTVGGGDPGETVLRPALKV